MRRPAKPKASKEKISPRPAPAGLRERKRQETRERLTRAAMALFLERGFEATTLAEVGAAAELSRGAPGYFFGSKEQLYRAVLGRAFSETVDLIRSAGFGSGRFADVTAAAIGHYLDFLASRPTFVRLVVRECLDGGRFLEGLPEHLASIAEGLRALDADSSEVRGEIDPRHLLLSGISLCWFPLVARPLLADLGFDPDTKAFTEERKRQVIDLFLHGSATQ